VSASIELYGAVLDTVTPQTAALPGAKVKMLSAKRMKRSGKNDESKRWKDAKFRASLLRHFFAVVGI
jgi:hypothetical protein